MSIRVPVQRQSYTPQQYATDNDPNYANQGANISDPTAREAEQNWQNQWEGVARLPSVRKGRVSYATARENSLQNFYKDRLKQNQIQNYNNFDVDKYVKGESDVARRNMARNVMDSQKTIKGNANSSGMLFSGRRQMGEALVGQQANLDFQKYQQDLIGNTLKQKQQLAADPLQGIANQSSADLARSLQMQQIQSGLQQQTGQLMNSGIGLIGSGLGSYYGNKNAAPLAAPQFRTPSMAGQTYRDTSGSV